jgi:alpha-N-arabinofuranosidase
MAVLAASAGAQQYMNPVVRGMNPDPSVVRVGADYYLATSSFEFFPSCPIYHSVDLVHWQRIGYALESAEQFAALDDEHPSTYACTLRYHAGIFYALTTDVRGGGNFLVTAKDPAGPWSLPKVIDRGMFDPSLFFETDGKVYYTRRGPGHGQAIVQAEIDPATGKLLTPLRTISNGMMTWDAEGPHLYKINGWYYLSLAEGGSRFLHMETIGRARSPWGPFAPDPASPWVSQHVSWDFPVRTLGHCDLVDTQKGDWWTVCLGTRHFKYGDFSLGRETFLFHVNWKNGWPAIAAEDTESLRVQHAPPGDHPFAEEPERDDFSVGRLGLDWNTFGPAGMKTISLSERKGFLRLHGRPTGLSFKKATAFVGRRQTEWKTTSTVRMEFEPREDGDAAGLTAFMSPRYHYDLVKTRCGASACVELIKQVADMRVVAAEAPAPEGAVLLRIQSDAEEYQFSFAADVRDAGAAKWTQLGTGEERLISSEVADVWSGAYVAMFSECRDAANGPPADFDWFDYKTGAVAQGRE